MEVKTAEAIKRKYKVKRRKKGIYCKKNKVKVRVRVSLLEMINF